MSQGHDKTSDLWAFGVLIYELLVGRSVFYKSGQKQIDMFKQIVRVAYEVPDSIDATSADLIKKLLVRNPAKRLGNLSNGSKDVRNHPWFESINWNLLLKKGLDPPWIPVIPEGSAVTDSHFDASEGAYRELSNGMPLTREEQSFFKTF
jgi:protein kinase A